MKKRKLKYFNILIPHKSNSLSYSLWKWSIYTFYYQQFYLIPRRYARPLSFFSISLPPSLLTKHYVKLHQRANRLDLIWLHAAQTAEKVLRVHLSSLQFQHKILTIEFPDRITAGRKPRKRSFADESLNCSLCHSSTHFFCFLASNESTCFCSIWCNE